MEAGAALFVFAALLFLHQGGGGVHGSLSRAQRHLHEAAGASVCTHHVHADAAIPSYAWMSAASIRQKAQVNPGNRLRLRAAIDRYIKGQNITVVFLGGSISAGQGAVDGKAFPFWAEEILSAGMPGVRIHNGAVPGTVSAYMSVCHNVHSPREADVIFLDYTLNDPMDTHPLMDNNVRRPFERLLRKLLSYPRAPAVILMHSYKWFQEELGNYFKSSEREFHEFAMFYGLQELSVKAAAWNLMRTGVPGFITNRTRGNQNGQSQPELDPILKGQVFYWDVIHPDGQTGHKFMGEIAAQALLDAVADVKATPVTDEELAFLRSPLPPPMLWNNWESVSDKCFIGPAFVEAVIEPGVWVYTAEGSVARAKFGFISDTVGSVMKIQVNTSSPTGKKDKEVTVEISYLKSYVNMGRASVKCASGCTCEETNIDGHCTEKTSLLNLHEFKATQHDQCIISITVLPESTVAGKHKVKIAGITISEEAGGEGIKNNMAFDMVAEGMSAGGTSAQFDLKKWGRLF